MLLLEELQRSGVELVFLNRTIGVSPEEDLLLQMQGMIAEYERAKIMERSRRGKRHAARRGSVSVLCAAPYGYKYISKHAGGGQAQYQTAFFLLQGVAVVGTARVNTSGWRAVPWTVGTLAFNLASSVLFFASIHGLVPFYALGLPAWLEGW